METRAVRIAHKSLLTPSRAQINGVQDRDYKFFPVCSLIFAHRGIMAHDPLYTGDPAVHTFPKAQLTTHSWGFSKLFYMDAYYWLDYSHDKHCKDLSSP